MCTVAAGSCGSGFWGGQRPTLAHYVPGMGPMDRATAAGGRSCCLSSDQDHRGHRQRPGELLKLRGLRKRRPWIVAHSMPRSWVLPQHL